MDNAFVLRFTTGGGSWLEDGLEKNKIYIGWSQVPEVLEKENWIEFREIVHKEYYSDEGSYRKSGNAAGSLWRFIRDMSIGDYVIIPVANEFYICVVESEIKFEKMDVQNDRAFQRKVKWLNEGNPIPRKYAASALQYRMKIQHCCGNAGDLLNEIKEVLETVQQGEKPDFIKSLRLKLIEETKNQLLSGVINDRIFETLIRDLLESMGGKEGKVIARQKDHGVDIKAIFEIANTFSFGLGVQAKHFQPDPPVEAWVVEQLADGMEAEEINHGWVVTSGTISPEAIEKKEKIQEEKGFFIELIDGDMLAAMIVESGIKITS